MSATTRKLLVIGAHPDGCKINAGGLAAEYAARNDSVTFFSLTNGATGQHKIGGVELTRHRAAEARAAANVTNANYHPDHRYAGTLVGDAAYLVKVRNMCPLPPHSKLPRSSSTSRTSSKTRSRSMQTSRSRST